jgi:hypothetical protein
VHLISANCKSFIALLELTSNDKPFDPIHDQTLHSEPQDDTSGLQPSVSLLLLFSTGVGSFSSLSLQFSLP